jgi:putative transposase
MPSRNRRRQRNYNDPGDAHQLTFSCYHRYRFVKAERTCNWLKEAIDQARVEFDFAVWAYVFMPEWLNMDDDG